MAAPTLRPLRVTEILDVAIKIYTKNAATLWKIVALIVVPVNIMSALVLVSTFPDEVFDPDFGSDPTTASIDPDQIWTIVGANVLVAIIAGITVLIATAACLKAVSDAYLGSKPDASSSLKFAAKRTHSLVWVAFLGFLIPTLGLLLLIVPGVWWWVSFTVAAPVFLIEGPKGFKALRRSFRLVKGRWWPVFGAVLVGFMLAGAIQFAIGALTAPLVFTDAADNLFLTVAVDTLANTIAGVLTTPFQAALIAILYFDLRVRKEGFDLELLAQRIGTAPDFSQRPDFFPYDMYQPEPPPPGSGT